MPIRASLFQLPSGARVARADCIGTISEEDANGWMRQVGPGGAFEGLPVLAVTLQIGDIGPGARGAFARRAEATHNPNRWMAVVVTNPVIRVTANFLSRVTRTKRLRLFQTEAEAVRWLDERALEDAAGKAAPTSFNPAAGR